VTVIRWVHRVEVGIALGPRQGRRSPHGRYRASLAGSGPP